jgi:lysozyme family protein
MSFDRAFENVIGVEGGYVNDPDDPGGETIYGITRRDHPQAWANGQPTLAQAKEIYRRDYWDAAGCGQLLVPLAELVFDCAVNQGVGTAKKLLQKALGVTQDGIIGRGTVAAIQRADQKELCALFMAERALRYTGTRNFDKYGRGWLKRLFIVAMEAKP